jgi:hypothetical protein
MCRLHCLRTRTLDLWSPTFLLQGYKTTVKEATKFLSSDVVIASSRQGHGRAIATAAHRGFHFTPLASSRRSTERCHLVFHGARRTPKPSLRLHLLATDPRVTQPRPVCPNRRPNDPSRSSHGCIFASAILEHRARLFHSSSTPTPVSPPRRFVAHRLRPLLRLGRC